MVEGCAAVREGIDMRSFQILVAVDTEIAPALIDTKDDQDIWAGELAARGNCPAASTTTSRVARVPDNLACILPEGCVAWALS